MHKRNHSKQQHEKFIRKLLSWNPFLIILRYVSVEDAMVGKAQRCDVGKWTDCRSIFPSISRKCIFQPRQQLFKHTSVLNVSGWIQWNSIHCLQILDTHLKELSLSIRNLNTAMSKFMESKHFKHSNKFRFRKFVLFKYL